jgi:hypothetical protein
MLTRPEPPDSGFADEHAFYGDEHLRPAWQAVVMTIVLVAASVLVLAVTG